ncbi:MAG: YaaL family protein [Sporomusaceae bacterium]|nr:YaaL family protein [Sporomusaceae bacterium]
MMKAKWIEQLNSLLDPENWLVNDKLPAAREPGLFESVEAARRDWLMAQRYYESVSDPELVDHAVYQIQAAEKKYAYLLREARRQGITHSPFPDPE